MDSKANRNANGKSMIQSRAGKVTMLSTGVLLFIGLYFITSEILILLAGGLPLAGLLSMPFLRRSRKTPEGAEAYTFAVRFSRWGCFLATSIFFGFNVSVMWTDPESQFAGMFIMAMLTFTPLVAIASFAVLMPILFVSSKTLGSSK